MCNIYRKHIALVAMFLAITFAVVAQTYTDSIKPFSGRVPFRTWSIGINGGALYPAVATGGSNDFQKPKVTIGYGANIKYQITHWFALQGDVIRGKLKGNNDENLSNGQPAFPNYRPIRSFVTDLHYAASLSGVFTLGNVNWLSIRNKVIPYVSVGAGIASWHTDIVTKATNPNSRPYDPKKENTKEMFIPVGMGLKFNISSSLNLDLGYRMNYVDNDALDGSSYDYTPIGPGRALHKDKFSYGFLGLEFVLGNKSKPQLMFDNPAARMNSNLQNQIDVLRSQLNLADTDGDGVADIFDKEPNTPAGCPVDTHGVTKDTDGDGVPDCRDKELITPTYCQPVDANGVGKCPPPECCNNMTKVETPSASCQLTDLPSLSFKGNAATLSADAKAILATVANKIKANPLCNITVTGYPAASKASQAVCNKRSEAIRMYLMSQEGISADRLNVSCEVGGGDANTIDLKVK
ncbi:MAG: OmpA family protein [Bacteroidota bacterium]|nr:OmpA family protein [Bacteroidota bacterium]